MSLVWQTVSNTIFDPSSVSFFNYELFYKIRSIALIFSKILNRSEFSRKFISDELMKLPLSILSS